MIWLHSDILQANTLIQNNLNIREFLCVGDVNEDFRSKAILCKSNQLVI